jgi:ATP-binding cassette, subfamily B, bacterial PglK
MNKYIIFLKKIFFLLGNDRRKIPFFVILFLFLSILDLIGIGLIAPYISIIIDPEGFISNENISFLDLPTNPNDLLLIFGIILVIVFLLKSISAIYVNRKILKFCHAKGADLQLFLMNAYQNMPYIDFVNRNSSEYVYRIESLAVSYARGTLQSVLRLLSELIVVFVIFIFLIMTDIIAVLVLVFLLGGFSVVYLKVFRYKLSEYGRSSNTASTELVKTVQESMFGLKEIRVLGVEPFFLKLVEKSARDFSITHVNFASISTAPRYIVELLLVCFVVIMVVMSIHFNKINELLPIISMFGIAALRLIPSVNQIISGISQIRFGYNGLNLLYGDVKDIRNNGETLVDSPVKTSNFNSIELVNINFRYSEKNAQVFKGLCMKINAGDTIGIIGTTGSGKTTLVDILLGLLQPTSGEILYNGKAIDGNSKEWISQIAYLPQEVFLVDSALRNNVALGVSENLIDNNRVIKSLKRANLENFVDSLPQGVDTLIGESGMRLSGGQRQRIALARAFYYDKNILVMDESTSSLDYDTEQEVVREIEMYKGDKTIIVIAHRLSTLKHCNHIYRLDGGSIFYEGDYSKIAQ